MALARIGVKSQFFGTLHQCALLAGRLKHPAPKPVRCVAAATLGAACRTSCADQRFALKGNILPLLSIEAASLTAKLLPSPINPSWIIEGNPQASSRVLSKSKDGSAWTAVWECTEGKFDWHYDLDETILILEGSIVLESDTSPPIRYGVGDVILFREGTHARWHVEGYVKKLAFLRSVNPALIGFGLRALRACKRKLSLASRAPAPSRLA